jgi:AcrR family transcriptional regulator
VPVAQSGTAADRRWSRTQPVGDRRSPAAPTVAGRATTLRGIEDDRPQGRERLLDAAVALIARDGVDNLRIARIATEAGVSPGLVHYHFASRDALLEEAIEHSYERAGNQRLAASADEGQGAPERLGAMIDQCLPGDRELRDDWVLWVELWLRSARHPALRPTAARLYARLHEWFAEAISDGVAAGELADCDVDRVTDRLLALIDGYGIRVLAGDPEMALERARAEIWAAIAPDLELPRV